MPVRCGILERSSRDDDGNKPIVKVARGLGAPAGRIYKWRHGERVRTSFRRDPEDPREIKVGRSESKFMCTFKFSF